MSTIPKYVTPTKLIKTVASTGTPEKIVADQTECAQAIIIARKAAQTDNATDIHIGPNSGDGNQPIRITPGGSYILAGVDLSMWYVDVQTNNDGVVVLYW